MLESPKLTARQQQILSLIHAAIASTGSPPTRAEIAAELGFKSANAAEEHLQALARKGVIELVSGTSRGIRLKGDTLRSINESRFKQFSMPLSGMAQLGLPLIGRVAAGRYGALTCRASYLRRPRCGTERRPHYGAGRHAVRGRPLGGIATRRGGV